ncbi:MAG: cupin domain-containing protein [Chloroflexi bacterium]|nr:cupin domain-containing protein [Chloroflexota bacterium]
MKVVRMEKVPKESAASPLFTGRNVTRQVLLPDSKEYVVSIVSFGRGVRNKFHAHNCEQILIVTAGSGTVATENEERRVGVGDIILIPAGEKHWHGATGDSEFSHIYVMKAGNKVTQLED